VIANKKETTTLLKQKHLILKPNKEVNGRFFDIIILFIDID
jgi:hypothetical protein